MLRSLASCLPLPSPCVRVPPDKVYTIHICVQGRNKAAAGLLYCTATAQPYNSLPACLFRPTPASVKNNLLVAVRVQCVCKDF